MRKFFFLIPAMLLSLAMSAQTDFLGGYFFPANQATLDGDIELNTLTSTPYIRYIDASPCGTATWEIAVSKPCLVSVTLNMVDNSWNYSDENTERKKYKNSGHIFKVRVLDGTTPKDSVAEASESSAYNNINLDGQLYFEKAGTYTIELVNSRAWSKCGLSGITMTAISVPETNFASDYAFVADAATLVTADEQFLLETSVTPHYIRYADHSQPGPYVYWNISVTRACDVSVTLNFANNTAFYSNNKHIMEVQLLDGYGNKIDTIAEGKAFDGDGFTENGVDKPLSGSLHIPAAGIYTVKMLNNRDHSKTGIYGVTMSYMGGAVVGIPDDDISINDAIHNGTRAGGVISFADATTGFAKWNVNVEDAGAYKVEISIKNQYGHNLTATFYKEDGETVVDYVSEGKTVYSENNTDGHAINLGAVYLKEGNYVLKVTNATSGSDAKIMGLSTSYMGGAVQNMPTTTNLNEAWFSAEGTRADGKIDFPNSTIQNGFVKWNVAFANAANYKVTLNVNSGNCKNYKVSLLDANGNDAVTPLTLNDCSTTGTPVSLDMGSMEVPVGSYVLMVTNSTQHSDAELISVKFENQGGGVVEIPNATIPFTEVMLSPNAYVDGSNLYFIDYEHRGHMAEEYAKWNIHAENDGVYQFTANCNSTTGWSNLKITIKDGENHTVFTDQTTSSYNGETVVSFKSAFLEAGNYVVQLENPTNHSHGYISSFSATAATNVFIVDENETDASVIAGKDATSWKALLKRTFKGGVYNSFCIPVEPGSGEMTSAFGAGYELLKLESATLEGSVLMLNFVTATSILAGYPYLLKPVADVANPIFNAHNIHNYTSNNTVHKDAADFIGTFVKQTIDANENNLYLGTDNKLYFSNNDVTIKGLRAYFHVNVSAGAISRARIVTQGQVVTDVELVETENNATKSIENGQLIITIDGVRYNVMGAKIQ